MTYRERNLGSSVVFLLPSLKLKEPSLNGPSIENRLHGFLMDNFGGYTAQAGNIFGYWREEDGRDSYGERREFSVAAADASRLPKLKEFLAAARKGTARAAKRAAPKQAPQKRASAKKPAAKKAAAKRVSVVKAAVPQVTGTPAPTTGPDLTA